MSELLLSPWRGVRPVRTHSVVLIVAGFVYVAIGLAYLRSVPTPERLETLQYALYWLNYNDWGYVWIFAGLLAILSSRWPPISETWGYTVLTGQSAAWGLFYGAGVVFGDAPQSGITGCLSWCLVAFMWWSISRLVNPEMLKVLLDRITTLQSENLALHDEVSRLRENRR